MALVQPSVGTGAEAFFTFLDPAVLPVPAALTARLYPSALTHLAIYLTSFSAPVFGSKSATTHSEDKRDNRHDQTGGAEALSKHREHLFLPVSWCQGTRVNRPKTVGIHDSEIKRDFLQYLTTS